jgi:micrococcal nuclease
MTPAYVYRGTITRVIDGDTFEALVDLGFEVHRKLTIRVRDLRCPERGTEEGRRVTFHAFALADATPRIVLRSHKDQQSFARWICDVWMDGDPHYPGRTYADALRERITWTDPGM